MREQPDRPAAANLLFSPSGDLVLTHAARTVTYREGLDYAVRKGSRTVTLLPQSRIPFLDKAELYRPANSALAIAHKRDNPDTWLYFSEGHHFHDLQVEASYSHDSKWPGYVPVCQAHAFPKTLAGLKAGKPVTVCIIGDSISWGANASKCMEALPRMPPYGVLFTEELHRMYAQVLLGLMIEGY